MNMDICENSTDILNGSSSDIDHGHTDVSTEAERIRYLNLNITRTLLLSFGNVLCCTAMLCNYLALKSLIGIKPKRLKSKYLLMNMTVADFLLPFVFVINMLRYIVNAYGLTSDRTLTCMELWFQIGLPFALYYQALASLVLVGDRLYAILAPFQYYTMGYIRWHVVCLIVGSWVFAIAFTSPPIVILFVRKLEYVRFGICFKLKVVFQFWGLVYRTRLLTGIGITTFSIYIILFMLVKRIRRTNAALTETQSANQQTSVSQTVTYFMVHCTTLALFLPRPIYTEFANVIDRETSNSIQLGLVLLYQLNCIVNPIVISLKIPAIKEQLSAILGCKLSLPISSKPESQKAETEWPTV